MAGVSRDFDALRSGRVAGALASVARTGGSALRRRGLGPPLGILPDVGADSLILSTPGRNYGDVFTNYKTAEGAEVWDRIDGILSCHLGLLLNFGARKVEVKRKIKELRERPRLSCHPVKKGFAPFSYVIVFVKRWTKARIRPAPHPAGPNSRTARWFAMVSSVPYLAERSRRRSRIESARSPVAISGRPRRARNGLTS